MAVVKVIARPMPGLFNRPRYVTAKIECTIEETETKKAERSLMEQVANLVIETHMQKARIGRGICSGFDYQVH